MRFFSIVNLFFACIFFILPRKGFSQNFAADTANETTSLHSAVNLYHQFLSPEPGLYNGSQYEYNAYYPFVINQGDPFYQSSQFDTGSVFYHNILYEKVPLLFDIIKEELLIKDPTNIYIIRLNSEQIKWFVIWGHTFTRLTRDSAKSSELQTGFYDLLYNDNTALYKKVSKTFKENSSSFQGLNKYVVELSEYFIRKDNQYFTVKNKKALLTIMNDKKKEIAQFMKSNKVNLRKDEEASLIKIVAYFNAITNNAKAAN